MNNNNLSNFHEETKASNSLANNNLEDANMGRDAMLQVTLITKEVLYSSLGSRLIFEIKNLGEDSADFLRLNIIPVEGIYDVDTRYQEIIYEGSISAKQYTQMEGVIKPQVGSSSNVKLDVLLRYNSSTDRDKFIKLAGSDTVFLYPEDDREWIKPPFSISAPARDLFYGRENILRIMADTLHPDMVHDTSMIIYGTKRAGKTSVVKKFISSILDDKGLNEAYISIYADIMSYYPGITNDGSFLYSLIVIIEKGLPEEIRKKLSIGYSYFKDFQVQPYDLFVFLLDEMFRLR
jgi:hypothetical protein